jgi:hypothetical protein
MNVYYLSACICISVHGVCIFACMLCYVCVCVCVMDICVLVVLMYHCLERTALLYRGLHSMTVARGYQLAMPNEPIDYSSIMIVIWCNRQLCEKFAVLGY